MQVLIVGGGGREHALGYKIRQSPMLKQLFFAPGNPGTAKLGQNVRLNSNDEFRDFCTTNHIDLVVVGPEAPLVDGLTDVLESAGIPCFGPSAAAAELEGSKEFAKKVMDATQIPTAAYASFTDYQAALEYVRKADHPIVVKADGLAAGKGVTICENLEQSEAALTEAMKDQRFGEAGSKVVIEEFLVGVEASFHVITDGKRAHALIAAKDHKALLDGDKGPNTGGMGTMAPNPLVTPEMATQITNDIAQPVFDHMAAEGTPFKGVLFIGLMLTDAGPKVLEFNVRFGDPETQVMLPLLDYDLLPILYGAAKGALPAGDFQFKDQTAVCVVLAGQGYPGSPRKGDPISGLGDSDNRVVFHAGTRELDGTIYTNGGRVLGLTAWAETLEGARKAAYQMVETVDFEGKTFRTDIGVFK